MRLIGLSLALAAVFLTGCEASEEERAQNRLDYLDFKEDSINYSLETDDTYTPSQRRLQGEEINRIEDEKAELRKKLNR